MTHTLDDVNRRSGVLHGDVSSTDTLLCKVTPRVHQQDSVILEVSNKQK